MKLFRYDSGLFRVLSLLGDLILLNILWILTSIPLVTIGASTSALYTITMKIVAGEEGYVIKPYFSAFLRNFKQATILWIICAAIGAWIWFFFSVARSMDSSLGRTLQLMEAAVLIILILALLYLFPMQSRYQNSIKGLLYNSFYLSLRYLPYSLLMLVIAVSPFLLLALFQEAFNIIMAIWISLGVSGTAYGISFFICRIFHRVENTEQTAS